MNYQEKLKDPRWQRKRLEIMSRDGFKCVYCGRDNTTLHVHHKKYAPSRMPWDGDDKDKITLCEDCHDRLENVNKKIVSTINGFIKDFESIEAAIVHWKGMGLLFKNLTEHAKKQVEMLEKEKTKSAVDQ